MFRLRIGYLIGGITTGLILLLGFFWSLPDGKLHIVFCNVGQGDAAYIRFPDGRDMLVDGGPNDQVLQCLGRHMPFWDRYINIILMTHPQKDHMQGLISVLDRYGVDYFMRSDISNTTEGYKELINNISGKHVRVRYVISGEVVKVGSTTLSVLWPSGDQIARMRSSSFSSDLSSLGNLGDVLGAKAPSDLNDGSIVFALRYGSFDALFPGDADTRVENGWRNMELARLDSASSSRLADDTLEVLKFPHHGSKTAMTEGFLETLKPKLAVISVGKNSYGHPAEETLRLLRQRDSKILRTDKEGDIEVVSDGITWNLSLEKLRN